MPVRHTLPGTNYQGTPLPGLRNKTKSWLPGSPVIPTFVEDTSTSSYGQPIAIVYGTRRIPGRIVLAGSYLTGYTNMNDSVVEVALCEGTIDSVLAVWQEQELLTLTTAGMTGATNGAVLPGELPVTSSWTWLATNVPDLELDYGGVAMACCSTTWTQAATGELSRRSYEVRGLLSTRQDGSTTAYDADAPLVINDLLTSDYRGLEWDSSLIGDWLFSVPFAAGPDGTAASGYMRYCQVQAWYISLALTSQRPVRDILAEILAATDAVALWSEGVLKIRPLGEFSITDGVDTYTPAMAPLYDLGARETGADFLADVGEPPVTMERVRAADVYNSHPVEYSNRFPARVDKAGTPISEPFNSYNPDLEEGVPDPVDVEARGLRKADPISLPCITRPAHAKEISRLLTQRALYTERNRYKFRLGWRYALLEPTDLVTLTDAGLGLSRQLVRITEIEEGEDGAFDVVAEEVGTIATASAATYTVT